MRTAQNQGHPHFVKQYIESKSCFLHVLFYIHLKTNKCVFLFPFLFGFRSECVCLCVCVRLWDDSDMAVTGLKQAACQPVIFSGFTAALTLF